MVVALGIRLEKTYGFRTEFVRNSIAAFFDLSILMVCCVIPIIQLRDRMDSGLGAGVPSAAAWTLKAQYAQSYRVRTINELIFIYPSTRILPRISTTWSLSSEKEIAGH
jgi:hypothetical protein